MSDTGTANSVCSLPPCGGGLGRGVARLAMLVPLSHDPHPQPLPTRGRGAAPAFASRVLAALWLSAFGSIAVAQDEATPPPKDTIFARKIVMATIDMNMDEVETMLAPG